MVKSKKFDSSNILKSAPIGILVADTEGNILQVNSKLVEIMGSPSEKATLAINLFTFPNLIKSKISDDIKKVIETGKPMTQNRKYTTKWGKSLCLRLHMDVIKDSKKNIVGIECFIEDATKHHNLQQQLLKSRKEYESFAANVPVGLYRVSKNGKVLYANKYCMNLMGVKSLSKLKKMNLYDDGLIRGYPREEFEKNIESNDEIYDFEASWIDRFGNQVWTVENAKIVRPLRGGAYYEGTIKNITNRKDVESALKKTQTKYEKLINNISIGIYRTTPSGEILVFNPYMLNLFGFKTVKEARNFNLESEDFSPMYERKRFKKILDEQGEINDLESQFRSVNNKKIWIRESAAVVRDSNGKILYYEGVVQDITKRKIAEDKLFDSYKHLGTLNRQIGILADLNKYKDISNPSQIYSMIMKYSMTLSNSSACFIFRYSNKDDSFSLIDWDGDFGEIRGCSKEKKYMTHKYDCFSSLVNILLIQKRDFSNKDRLNLDFVVKNNFEYMVHVPLMIKNKLLGSILLCSPKKYNLISQEMDIIEIFGVQCTFLLMNIFTFVDR